MLKIKKKKIKKMINQIILKSKITFKNDYYYSNIF